MMKKKVMTIGILLLAFMANFPKYHVSADEEKDEPPSKEVTDVKNLELTTPETKLKTHNQKHEKGTPEQLANVNKGTMKFIKDIALQANESGLENDLYASITIAQAVLESGSGTSALAQNHNNLFGIKGSYKGNHVAVKTTEHKSNGEKFLADATFKSYPSWGESIEDHDQLLRHGLNGYYHGTWKSNTNDYTEATQFLVGRYASDPDYASKLNAIIEKYNLTRFDRKLSERDLKWLESDSLDPWELPIVPPKVNKKKTWSTTYSELPSEFAGLEINFPDIEPNEEIPTSTLYITERAKYVIDTEHEESQYTKNPKEGDVAVFKIKNSEGELVERYGYIESVKDGKALVTEAITVDGKVTYVYRVIEEETIHKFKFIDVEQNIAEQRRRMEEMSRSMMFIGGL